MAKVSFPARCAVAVVYGEHLVSQVYPASVPVEMFIDDIVELLNAELRRRGLTGLDAGLGYELNRANGTRLDVAKTLDELGVEDGTTLVLVPASEGESFQPQYESLSTGLARVGKKLFQPVTVETAAHTAMAVVAMIGSTVLGLAVRNRVLTESLISAVVVGVAGLLAAGGAFAVWRWWRDRSDLLTGFGWVAVPLLAVTAGAAAPGRVGAAHVFIATLAFGVLTYGFVTLTRRNYTVASTAVTLCALGTILAGLRMWRPINGQWLGMGTLIALLLLLSLAPTFALWTAHIHPPHFGSITGRDLFRRGAGAPVDTVSPVEEDTEEEEPDPDSTPRGEEIATAARRANQVLTGICVAAGAALPFAVWATLMPGRPRSAAAAVLAGLFVLIFISRGRAFADKRQAVALVLGASTATCAGVAKYVLQAPADSWAPLVWGALALLGFAAVGLIAALLVPVTKFTPLVRMVTEWLELAAIVASMPLAAWIGGLFTWVRMR